MGIISKALAVISHAKKVDAEGTVCTIAILAVSGTFRCLSHAGYRCFKNDISDELTMLVFYLIFTIKSKNPDFSKIFI